MAITAGGQGSYTGLLGYNREYQYLGNSTLPFRLVEKYDYTVKDYDFANRTDLPATFKTSFAAQMGRLENDITVKSVTFPNSQDHLQSKVGFQEYKISLEAYSSGTFVDASADGYENSKNAGLSSFGGHPDLVTSFADDFSFSQDGTDKKNYSHNISLSMQTGVGYETFEDVKTLAGNIAYDLFDQEAASLSQASFGNYGAYSDTSARQYFTETFDKQKFTFSYSKNRSVDTNDIGDYNYSVGHTIGFENGLFNIQEKLTVIGKKTFQQALDGYNALSPGAEGRCETALSDYTPMANLSNGNWSFYADLINLNESLTYNKPEIKVEATLSYSNDESLFASLKKAEKFSVSRSPLGVIGISHNINYGVASYLTGTTDNTPVSGSNNIVQVMAQDRNDSIGEAVGIYNGITNLVGVSTGIVRTKSNIGSPQRGKGYSATFSYSDDPAHDMSQYVNPYTQATVTGFNRLSIDYQDTAPSDSVSEYKVINRPTQNSIISFGYQNTPATFSVNINGKLKRGGNMFTSTPLPFTDTLNLLEYSNKIFLDEAISSTGIYTYFLRDYKYNVDSNRSYSLSVQYEYMRKKYGNIS